MKHQIVYLVNSQFWHYAFYILITLSLNSNNKLLVVNFQFFVFHSINDVDFLLGVVSKSTSEIPEARKYQEGSWKTSS